MKFIQCKGKSINKIIRWPKNHPAGGQIVVKIKSPF